MDFGMIFIVFLKEKKINKNMENKTFENYLEEQHAEQYNGLDDEMPDDRNDWFENLDVQEVIDYAEKFVSQVREETLKSVLSNVSDETQENVEEELKIILRNNRQS